MIRFLSTLLATLAVAGAAGAQNAASPPPPQGPAPVSPPPLPPGPPPGLPNAAPSLGKLSTMAEPPEWARLQALSRTLTAEEFDAAFSTFYSDHRNFPVPWQRDPVGISVPTGGPNGTSVRIDFRTSEQPAVKPERFWRTAAELPPLEGKPVLTGVRIALDPGHIGGAYAQIEERLLTFHPDKPEERVTEGDHVLKVAQMLKPRLEALGARVFLVREAPEPVTPQRPADLRNAALNLLREHGITNPQDGYGGTDNDSKVLTIQWQAEKLFYRNSEIRARGRKVNVDIKPDIVVCMHLNAEGWGDSAAPQYSPANHLHVMVNGCYDPGELQMQDIRYEMFNRLFHRMHEVELPLADSVAKAMADSTGLPAYVYTTPNARLVSPTGYVYARNLLANRIYDCPVIYLEPYVMNNAETYQRLIQGSYVGRTLTNGRLRTSIYEDYAQGVLDGLVNYYRSQRK